VAKREKSRRNDHSNYQRRANALPQAAVVLCLRKTILFGAEPSTEHPQLEKTVSSMPARAKAQSV